MKDRVERFVILPFSIGCSSQSSVAVATRDEPKKPKLQTDQPAVTRREGEEISCKERIKIEENSCEEQRKDSSGLVASPKANISDGMYRLIRSLKSFSQLMIESIGYKEEEAGEMEAELEIGYPTDVKHVTHIGLDGTMTTCNAVRGWENLHLTSSTTSFSFGRLEFADVAAQANQTPVP